MPALTPAQQRALLDIHEDYENSAPVGTARIRQATARALAAAGLVDIHERPTRWHTTPQWGQVGHRAHTAVLRTAKTTPAGRAAAEALGGTPKSPCDHPDCDEIVAARTCDYHLAQARR